MANADLVLLTGLTGYIAKHTAALLLARGYNVRATVRSKARAQATLDALRASGVNTSNLTLVEADLGSDAGWSEAASDCRFVHHMASPFPLQQPRDRMALVPEARDGTLRVLRAARAAGAERVVLTSSVVAVMAGHPLRPGHVWTEDDWADTESKTINPYRISKTLAERAAWDDAKAGGYELVAINPAFVIGPGIGEDAGASIATMKLLLAGKYPGVPKISFPVVDVRDVAEMHVAAMTTPAAAGKRFIAAADGIISLMDWGKLVGRAIPEVAKKMPRFELPDWLVKTVALFDRTVAVTVPDLGRMEHVSNRAAREILGIQFRSMEEAIVSCAKFVHALGQG